jgi:hypothetical protein
MSTDHVGSLTLSSYDWSVPLGHPVDTSVIPPLFAPSEDYRSLVADLFTSYDAEVQLWLSAGEDTLRRIDELFS